MGPLIKGHNITLRVNRTVVRGVKSMQKSGTDEIRTQIQPSKPKRKITNITNSQNTKRTYGQKVATQQPKPN